MAAVVLHNIARQHNVPLPPDINFDDKPEVVGEEHEVVVEEHEVGEEAAEVPKTFEEMLKGKDIFEHIFQSNGRAEVAVKSTERILRGNTRKGCSPP